MSHQPLRVAFLWHQHQPYYKEGNTYLMPWTRLHATKDYYDMTAAMAPFATLKQSVNVVPSLLIQLIDYAENGATDHVLDLARRPASELTDDEKLAILRSFFLCNAPRMIQPYDRYRELYERAGSGSRDDSKLEDARSQFTVTDWLDLQVWYNLTWIGEYSRGDEPFKSLLAKGRNFSEDEKLRMLDASIDIVARVIPAYRAMMAEGRVELSVTPFYHPILPIVCDSNVAKQAIPDITLPHTHIQWPEDARVQVERALALFEDQFGRKPEGMWPSEGSVSDGALDIIASCGLSWVATDEEILRRTLGERMPPLGKFFPWTLQTPSGPMWVLFRDHVLSDAIGFVYSSWAPKDAAGDFYQRLVEIRNRIIQELGADALADAIVPVILDGENCWEYYESNGRPFLESLYGLLAESNEVATTTIAAELARHTPSDERTLDSIFAGSWIGANFRIWIGHVEDNTAWDLLAAARSAVQTRRNSLDQATFDAAMEEIYIAEGSDWYWWFGDENEAANEDEFDRLFRYHVRRVYELIGVPSPPALELSIRGTLRQPAVTPPTLPITPVVDGRRSDTDWSGAGHIVVERVGGSMHRADVFERHVYYGADAHNLYLRFDTTMPLPPESSISICVQASGRTVTLRFTGTSVSIEASAGGDGHVSIGGIEAAIAETLEAAVPLRYLAETRLDSFGLACEVIERGRVVDRFPLQGVVECPL